jgi:ribonuclease G
VVEKDLVINSSPTGIEIALLEDERLVEIHREKTNKRFSVGDIFLGYVKKLRPGLNAAFVEIGHTKEAFLHYTDLGPPLRSLLKFTSESISGKLNTHLLEKFDTQAEIVKTGKIDQVLHRRDPILVQVLKEPISTKGPRLSCEITLPGRYIVLCPFSDYLAISKKIANREERKRLKLLIESIRPKGFGLIVRTAAEGKKVADLHEELEYLTGKWKTVYEQLRNAKPPKKLLEEIDKTSSILREILDDSFNKILVNDDDMYRNVKEYLKGIAPDKVKMVQRSKGNAPIFDKYGISRQIKSSFGKTYTMSSGAYLVIEHTEAMHVIDVNSGPKSVKGDQENSALHVNIQAAKEIARQLRLRDIGGLIIVDFIDMKKHEHKQFLYRSIKEYMENDRARHTILPLSRFGLMQITRERTRPVVQINTEESCPTCRGSGKVTPTLLVSDLIARDLNHILNNRPKAKIKLVTHPFVYAFLTKGFPSQQHKWYFKYKKFIRISENSDYAINEYKFYDSYSEEIKLN